MLCQDVILMSTCKRTNFKQEKEEKTFMVDGVRSLTYLNTLHVLVELILEVNLTGCVHEQLC